MIARFGTRRLSRLRFEPLRGPLACNIVSWMLRASAQGTEHGSSSIASARRTGICRM